MFRVLLIAGLSFLLGVQYGLQSAYDDAQPHARHQTQGAPQEHRGDHEPPGPEAPFWWESVLKRIDDELNYTSYRDIYLGYPARPGHWGHCQALDDDKGLLIALNPSMVNRDFVWDTVIHEWAHAVLWDTPQADPHGPIWGVKYAELYRLTIDPGQPISLPDVEEGEHTADKGEGQ